MATLRGEDPVAVQLVQAIRSGDLDQLQRLVGGDAGLVSSRIRGRKGGTRTLLHVATDWPGYFPHGPAIVASLIDAGADPNATVTGADHAETPLHWAASSDDVDVAAALIDRGADIDASGSSIAGGGPLDDAVGYGCWHVARLLVERGARTELWHAAALGMLDRVAVLLDAPSPPTAEQLDEAFWQACHGGQRRMAEYLLSRGATLDAIPGFATQTPLEIAGSLDTRRESLLVWLRERGATSVKR